MSIFFNILVAIGGLAMFMYGMKTLSSGLEKSAGGLMEKILAKVSGNIFTSIFFGAVVTAAVQSSTATTVIVIGLVNAGLLKLRGAVGIIMGANIGTTMTAHILRLASVGESDSFLINLVNPVNLSAILAIAGMGIIMFSKKNKKKTVGEILLGVAILFTGITTMKNSIGPLFKDPDTVQKIFSLLKNPALGILVGIVVTICTQSSAAAVGILQIIASGSGGAVLFASAFPIIMGTNIGTCATPLLSSLKSSKNAKRAALLHFYFNSIGTILFLIVIYAVQFTVGWSFWNEGFDDGDIANFHTLFNVIVTAIFIPFAGVLEKLACITVRDKPGEEEDVFSKEDLLDERFLVTPNVAIAQTREAVVQMGIYARKNFESACMMFDKYDMREIEKINEREELLDRLEDRVGQYLIKLNDCKLNEDEGRMVTTLFHLISEFERIGDYSVNLCETANVLYEEEAHFSERANWELSVVHGAISEIIGLAIEATKTMDMNVLTEIEPLEEVVDRLVEELKAVHIDRSKNGQCPIEVGIHFLDILTNVERISDHCSNIAIYLISTKQQYETLKKHEYLDELHKHGPETYEKKLKEYSAKYSLETLA
ncbi:Na/Pi cotransporter family protein [Ruminococcus albus]|uniref:Na+/Picotransporter n=1 Tax=Ruminococcus albus (strain ATCC 27210 / DSM 20455 / JCM 14654 / NCDO 2250 / 7) TaxID=697329 RepID=E6UFB2_RUMA7|nr:Na/Pi cotransporter family protein [Ruminococcus albus]ADU20998.1 Na+/Picotransporter [Ruminococcus albus 7 = DSM 20455]